LKNGLKSLAVARTIPGSPAGGALVTIFFLTFSLGLALASRLAFGLVLSLFLFAPLLLLLFVLLLLLGLIVLSLLAA
jgi:hypothetical protein